MKVWSNGHILSSDAAGLKWNDRGFLLGDGVFETIAMRQQKICHWPAHWARLQTAMGYFGLVSHFSATQIEAAITKLASDMQITNGAIRVSVSAGAGGRGLAPLSSADPTWVISLTPLSPVPRTISLAQSNVIRTAGNPSTQHKTLSYIDNIVARRQVEADEALLLNQYGRVACAAAGNIFILKNGDLLTPDVSEGALAGVIRGALLAMGTVAGFTCRTSQLSLADMQAAEAIFITNSLIGAQSVTVLQLTDHSPIKKGSPHMAAILEIIEAQAF
jgi:branched-chain amino acid aminotransferase